MPAERMSVNGMPRQHSRPSRAHESGAVSAALIHEAARHVDELGVRRLLERDRARLERHAADRARPGLVAHDLRVHRAGPLGLRRHRFARRLQRHPALRAQAWTRQPDVRVHRTRVLPNGNRRRRGTLLAVTIEEALGIGAKPLQTASTAEVVGLTAMFDMANRFCGVDGHSAHGIDDLARGGRVMMSSHIRMLRKRRWFSTKINASS